MIVFKQCMSDDEFEDHLYDRGGRPGIQFIASIQLIDLIRCGDVMSLNDLVENFLPSDSVLTDVSYRVVGHELPDVGSTDFGRVHITVDAELISGDQVGCSPE